MLTLTLASRILFQSLLTKRIATDKLVENVSAKEELAASQLCVRGKARWFQFGLCPDTDDICHRVKGLTVSPGNRLRLPVHNGIFTAPQAPVLVTFNRYLSSKTCTSKQIYPQTQQRRHWAQQILWVHQQSYSRQWNNSRQASPSLWHDTVKTFTEGCHVIYLVMIHLLKIKLYP